MSKSNTPQDITVGEIVKDENNILLISIREYKGHKYCDIRRWFKNGRGHMIADRDRGITISRKSIDNSLCISRMPALLSMARRPFEDR
jgi:hypothetical protein